MIQFNINNYTEDLIEKDCIYYSKNKSKVSYPIDGNDTCFAIKDNSFLAQTQKQLHNSACKKICKRSVLFEIGGGNGFVSKGLEENGIQTA